MLHFLVFFYAASLYKASFLGRAVNFTKVALINFTLSTKIARQNMSRVTRGIETEKHYNTKPLPTTKITMDHFDVHC